MSPDIGGKIFFLIIVVAGCLGFGFVGFIGYEFATVPANGISCASVQSALTNHPINVIEGQAWARGNSVGLYNMSQFINLADGHTVIYSDQDPYGHAWTTYSFTANSTLYFLQCGTENWR